MDASLPDLSTPVRDVARPDPVRLFEDEAVSQALERLRGESIGERVFYFYVTDREGRLVGVVPTRRLLLARASTLIRGVMVSPAVAVSESESFGHALETLTKRRLLALPVVDDSGRLKGVLDVSSFTQDLLDLERRESAEEVFQLAGIHIEEERSRSTWWVVANRFPWLLCNIASGIAAAFISNRFDYVLKAVVALAFFVPLLLTMAESIAMQSLTMSLNQLLATRRARRRASMFREMRVGVLLGLSSGLIVGVIGILWLRVYEVALIVAGGILMAGVIGATMGFFVPRLVRRWRLDPMIASGPVTLAITDLGALACYFALSAAVLI